MHAPVRRYPPLEPPIERGGRDRGLRDRNYSPSPPPPKMRRAPPRSPPGLHEDIDSGPYPSSHRPGRGPNMRPDEWADPWMRGGMGPHHLGSRGGHRPFHNDGNTSRNGRADSLRSPPDVGEDGRPQRGRRTGGRRRSYSSGSSDKKEVANY